MKEIDLGQSRTKHVFSKLRSLSIVAVNAWHYQVTKSNYTEHTQIQINTHSKHFQEQQTCDSTGFSVLCYFPIIKGQNSSALVEN